VRRCAGGWRLVPIGGVANDNQRTFFTFATRPAGTGCAPFSTRCHLTLPRDEPRLPPFLALLHDVFCLCVYSMFRHSIFWLFSLPSSVFSEHAPYFVFLHILTTVGKGVLPSVFCASCGVCCCFAQPSFRLPALFLAAPLFLLHHRFYPTAGYNIRTWFRLSVGAACCNIKPSDNISDGRFRCRDLLCTMRCTSRAASPPPVAPPATCFGEQDAEARTSAPPGGV